MKNLNKITKYFITLFWLGFCCTTLKAEVVITEFFILQADSTHTPQYIELYNDSTSSIDLTDWSITTRNGEGIEFEGSPYFNNSSELVQINNIEIDPFGYFLISSSFCNYSTSGCYFYNEFQSKIDIDAFFLFLPLEGQGSIILKNSTDVVVDSIGYDIAGGWPVDENSKGHSLRLHSPELDNSLPENWSLSPKTENSLWLYTANAEIKNFGSPREENAFRLFDIQYSDSWFPDTSYANGGTHTIYGDYNDFYRAEPFVDDNGNGECDECGYGDEGELYHDRNLNNQWDYQDNNYDSLLTFSWDGTFIDTTVVDSPAINYKIIIEKNNTPVYNSSLFDSLGIGTEISILPFDLLIDSLGQEREIAEYTWTVELIKTYSDYVDTIYSDIDTLIIDASDYGRYGCVDNGSCTDDGNCPTNAYYESSYISNHPTGCTPGDDIGAGGCYSALNYYENANINSNTCHYVSLSIPAFVVDSINTIVTVPVYLYNDSSANIDSIAYTLSFDNSLGIAAFQDGTFSGTVETELWGDENIVGDQNGNISVSMLTPADNSFESAGIITYLDFNLTGSQGEFINLSFSEVRVKGGIPENDISVPGKVGEIVILQTDYEIFGQVYYYDSSEGQEPFQIPNVILKLDKNYDGVSSETNYFEITNVNGFFKFDSLTEGNYSLSFSKESGNDCNGDYISGTDISRIARHVIGSEPFNTDQFIAADVSLDGTVSGYDASLVAQYSVGLIVDYNDIKTHWIFQPFNQETLPDVHAELLKENGQYSIEYKPLVLDDKSRNISAYRLGDVNGNYCYDHDQLLRYNNSPVQFTNIAIDYMPVITLPLIISEAIFLEGMDIEIGFDEDVFNPLSITFNNSNKVVENYQTVSNLLSKDKTIKTVTWALDEPQLIEGIIGEVNFEWKNKNKSGKIWLKEFQINDEPAIGGISLIGLSDTEVTDGVNIINSLVPEVLSLKQNYPNPFNPQTTIKWSMPLSGSVSLEVYNLQGQLIEHLFDGYKEVGMHEQEWDATAFPSGIYFYRLTTNKKTLQKVMLLLK